MPPGDGEQVDDRTDLLKRAYSAFNRGDFEAIDELIAEDGEIHRTGGLPPLRGREAIREWLRPDALEQRGDPVDFQTNGDRVLVTLDWHATGKGSRVQLRSEVFHLWTFRGDEVVRLELYFDRAEALEAAGLQD